MNKDEEIIFNVGIVGDTYVGKTCLLQKLLDKNFDLTINKPSPTIHISPSMFITSKDGKRIKIQFMDTAGAEKHHSTIWNNLKRACAFLIVFDLTDEVSFDNVIYWKDQIKEHVDLNNIILIMVANKCDLEKERKVTTNRIENFEKRNQFGTNYLFYETSAKTGHGIDECVEGLIIKIIDKYEKLKDKNSINQNIKIKHEIVKYDKKNNNNNDNNKNDDDKKKKKKSSCCIIF